MTNFVLPSDGAPVRPPHQPGGGIRHRPQQPVHSPTFHYAEYLVHPSRPALGNLDIFVHTIPHEALTASLLVMVSIYPVQVYGAVLHYNDHDPRGSI